MDLATNEWLVMVLMCVLLLFVIWMIPRLQLRTLRTSAPECLFNMENEARKTIGQVVAGLAIIGTFYSGVKTLKATQTQISISQEQLNISRDNQALKRYSRAISALNESSAIARIGGMFLLEDTAIGSGAKNRWDTYEMLSAYVRESVPVQARVSPNIPAARSDIDTAMLIIGRRDVSKDPNDYYVALENCDLRSADFQGGNFSNVSFFRSDLRKNDLGPVTVDKNTFFRGCHLEGTNLGEVKGLTKGQLRMSVLDSSTKFPKYYVP